MKLLQLPPIFYIADFEVDAWKGEKTDLQGRMIVCGRWLRWLMKPDKVDRHSRKALKSTALKASKFNENFPRTSYDPDH